MLPLNPLEIHILSKLLLGDDFVLEILRNQFRHILVRSRENTGVGFFTNFSVPPEIERIPNRRSLHLSDVNATASNVAHGIGFVLFVCDGALEMLEGFTYDEPWPLEISDLRLTYSSGDTRDWNRLKKALHGNTNGFKT
jgi:hypothetical protein